MSPQSSTYKKFLTIFRNALGISAEMPDEVSAGEWQEIFEFSKAQTVPGVVFEAVKGITGTNKPPLDVLMQWTMLVERIARKNEQLNNSCAELTKIFAEHGHRSAILKGQANALLYANPLSRQPGDIDIYIDGGERKALALLKELGKEYSLSYHHAHVKGEWCGAIVEVHFRPSSGNYNPFSNRRLQKFLNAEIQNVTKTDGGFYVPTPKFAQMMQLSHLMRHFISEGVGLRHVADYYMLLKSYGVQITADEIEKCGLTQFAGAVMWVLKELFAVTDDLLVTSPNETDGKILLQKVLEGGNFGRNSDEYKMMQRQHIIKRWYYKQLKYWKNITSWGGEMFWLDVFTWKNFVRRLPRRIRERKLHLED